MLRSLGTLSGGLNITVSTTVGLSICYEHRCSCSLLLVAIYLPEDLPLISVPSVSEPENCMS
jgi:hypothetical protein